MSYRTWSVDGFGVNVNKIIARLDLEGLSKLRSFTYSYLKANEEWIFDDYPEIKEYFNTPAKTESYLDDMINAFENYENPDNGFVGLYAFTANLFTWLWNLKGHNACVETVMDEFNSEDIYWLLGMCYPWGDNEFKTEDECRQAIIDTFEGLVSTDDIDFETIENGG